MSIEFSGKWMDSLNQSPLTPEPYVFQLVWTVLYILMIVSFIKLNNKKGNNLKIFIAQIFINLLWVYVFFKLHNTKLALVLLLVLIVLVYIMIQTFNKDNDISGKLQYPYLIWLFVALYLNYYIVRNN